VVMVLPVIRSCCLRSSPEQRLAWWRETDLRIERLRRRWTRGLPEGGVAGVMLGACRRRRGISAEEVVEERQRRWNREVDAITKELEVKIRRVRPATVPRIEARLARAAEVAREAAEEARIEALMHTAAAWNALGLPRGAPPHRIKAALIAGTERLRRQGASLDDYRALQAAGLECLNQLARGAR
jgi:hypothetical protein